MRVYLAGPILGATDQEAHGWREDIKRRLGGPWVEYEDPMDRDYRGIEEESSEEIVEGDKEAIQSCTHLLAFCPKPSVGTSMEIFYAKEVLGIPVFTIIPPGSPRSPWLLYHSTRVFEYASVAASALLRESVRS